jgi:hypothetical protein
LRAERGGVAIRNLNLSKFLNSGLLRFARNYEKMLSQALFAEISDKKKDQTGGKNFSKKTIDLLLIFM